MSVTPFRMEMQPARPQPRDPRDPPVADVQPFYPTKASVDRKLAAESVTNYQLPTDEEWRRLEGAETVARLIEEFGVKRVYRWLYNIAAMRNEAI